VILTVIVILVIVDVPAPSVAVGVIVEVTPTHHAPRARTGERRRDSVGCTQGY
jgi:hypothetical protein